MGIPGEEGTQVDAAEENPIRLMAMSSKAG